MAIGRSRRHERETLDTGDRAASANNAHRRRSRRGLLPDVHRGRNELLDCGGSDDGRCHPDRGVVQRARRRRWSSRHRCRRLVGVLDRRQLVDHAARWRRSGNADGRCERSGKRGQLARGRFVRFVRRERGAWRRRTRCARRQRDGPPGFGVSEQRRGQRRRRLLDDSRQLCRNGRLSDRGRIRPVVVSERRRANARSDRVALGAVAAAGRRVVWTAAPEPGFPGWCPRGEDCALFDYDGQITTAPAAPALACAQPVVADEADAYGVDGKTTWAAALP